MSGEGATGTRRQAAGAAVDIQHSQPVDRTLSKQPRPGTEERASTEPEEVNRRTDGRSIGLDKVTIDKTNEAA